MLNVSLIQLQYLVALDQHRHFIRAAESCFVTQPTLSMQMKKLEKELGVVLFNRNTSPMEPTRVGEDIIAQAKNILAETSKIEDILMRYKNELSGSLNIGIIPTISPYLMPPLIHAIKDLLPNVKLRFIESFTEKIIHDLKQEKLDFGILATPLKANDIEERPIFYEYFYAYLNPSHKNYAKDEIDQEDLLEEKLWLLSEGNCFRTQSLNLCSSKLQLNNDSFTFDYESGSLETLKRIVDIEGGSTLLPEWATFELNEKDIEHVRNFKNRNAAREISLVYVKDFPKTKLLESFEAILKDIIPKRMMNRNKSTIEVLNVM